MGTQGTSLCILNAACIVCISKHYFAAPGCLPGGYGGQQGGYGGGGGGYGGGGGGYGGQQGGYGGGGGGLDQGGQGGYGGGQGGYGGGQGGGQQGDTMLYAYCILLKGRMLHCVYNEAQAVSSMHACLLIRFVLLHSDWYGPSLCDSQEDLYVTSE